MVPSEHGTWIRPMNPPNNQAFLCRPLISVLSRFIHMSTLLIFKPACNRARWNVQLCTNLRGKNRKEKRGEKWMQWYYQATHGPNTTQKISLHVNEEMKLYNVCTLICTLVLSVRVMVWRIWIWIINDIWVFIGKESDNVRRNIICRWKRMNPIWFLKM